MIQQQLYMYIFVYMCIYVCVYKNDAGGTRTHSLLIRSQAPYPLGHGAAGSASRIWEKLSVQWHKSMHDTTAAVYVFIYICVSVCVCTRMMPVGLEPVVS